MGQRHRAAAGDLVAEQRDHAAVGAQHVAEAHGHVFRVAAQSHVLHDQLRDALGGAHHVGGVDRLVRGQLHVLLHAVFVRAERHVQRAAHVVLHGLGGAVLHQRHVLVRRRVEHHVRPILREHRLQPLPVADGADQHLGVQRAAVLLAQLVEQLVGVVLVDVEYDQPLRGEARDLAAQLGADGAAAARHQHRAVGQVAADRVHVQLHLVAAEQVGDVHVAHRAHLGLAVHHLGQHRHVAQLAVRLGADVHDPALVHRAGRGNGDDDLVDGVSARVFGDVLRGVQHLHPPDARAGLGRVVVHGDDHRGVAGQPRVPDGGRAGPARTHHHHPPEHVGLGALRGAPGHAPEGPAAHAGDHGQKRHDEPGDDVYRPGQGDRLRQQRIDVHQPREGVGRHHREAAAQRDGEDLLQPRVLPQPPVQPCQREAADADDAEERRQPLQRAGELLICRALQVQIKAQHHRKGEGHVDYDQIDSHIEEGAQHSPLG